MRVVELTVIGNIFRRSGKAELSISRVDVDPVNCDVRQICRNDRAHIVGGESRVEKIVVAETVIDARIKCGAELGSVRVEEKVVCFLSWRPNVGQGIQLE